MDPFLKLGNDLLLEGADPEVVAIFGDEVSAGEYVVALEYLTDTIVEFEIAVSENVKRQIKELGQRYEIERPSYIQVAAST